MSLNPLILTCLDLLSAGQPTLFGERGILVSNSGPARIFPTGEVLMPEQVGEGKILIVEDEKVVADSLGRILSSQGYDIRVVYSAEAALHLLPQWSHCPAPEVLFGAFSSLSVLPGSGLVTASRCCRGISITRSASPSAPRSSTS